jgi:hypothetical protein
MGVIVILYDGKPIRDRVPFEAPDDWLKHVTIAIRNESAKALIRGSVQIAFPRLGGTPMVLQDVSVGVLPDFQLYREHGEKASRSPGETPVSVPPGGYLEIPVAKDYDELRSKIEERAPLSGATLAVVDYGIYYFEGDLRWSVGSDMSFMRADRTTPGKYVPVPPDELMGKPQSSGH